ncbi:serine/threonine-protein kinase [Azospirillum sp. A39]|uniref:serine/threonine-protein kinase n=1 Tax=Azospirillum sp. A39 TaxID=3462279 RepID=UPI0040458430
MEPRAHSRTPAGGTAATAVGSLDEAAICQTLADYHGLQGRIVLGMVLRAHFEALVLTPTETIHLMKHLKGLLDRGQLVENAIARVSIVQARTPGHDQRSRRAAVQNAIAETHAKARAAQLAFADLPRARPPVEAVLALAPGKTPTGDADYDIRVALSLDLQEHRTWPGKLDRLLHWLQWQKDERLSAAVDGVVADVLCTGAAVQELFGGPLTPGAAAVALCELVLGRTSTGPAMGPDRAGVLNALFRQGKLPQSRTAVLDRVRRVLRAPQPLGRGQPPEEADLLKALLGQLLTRGGVVGTGAMAEALTIRYSRRLEQGGASAFRRSITGIGEGVSDLFCRIHYLCAVSTVAAAERHLGEIADALDAALGNELLVENAVLQAADTAALAEGMGAGAEAIAGSGLPGEVRARLAGRLAGLVDDFVQRGRLMHRLRQVEPVLRRRTLRLAELAASGLVREDGALPILRQQILEIVKQPQFQADLAAQQGSEVVQAEVRRLYELLDRLRQGGPAEAAARPAPRAAPRRAPDPAAVSATPTAVAPLTRPPPPAVADGARGAPPPRPVPAGAPSLAPPPAADERCPACFERRAVREACRHCGYPAACDSRPGIHLMPGTRLHGRYRVGRILGQGGFGATYLGWDERLQVKVAVKEYYPANLIARAPGGVDVAPFSDEHAKGFAAGLGKFLEEARLLARLRDVKEIVGVQDFFEENATAYLVMELLDGRTLKKAIAEAGGRIDCRRALTLVTPIMRALHAVHEQGLVHRDISPDNIFLTNTGERKLLDFGAARHSAGSAAGLTVILKPGYAPPEQYAQDGRQGPWTDVYALCATLYCAVVGKPPPDATARFMDDRVPRPSDLVPGVPAAFEAVLMGGLAMRWQERPQTVRALLKAFAAAMGERT